MKQGNQLIKIPLTLYIISQGHSFYFIFISFSFIVGVCALGYVFWLRFYVDGIWGLLCGAAWFFWGWGSSYKHQGIKLVLLSIHFDSLVGRQLTKRSPIAFYKGLYSFVQNQHASVHTFRSCCLTEIEGTTLLISNTKTTRSHNIYGTFNLHLLFTSAEITIYVILDHA